MKTTHEIIDEIAGYYNLDNRSIDEQGNCLYNGSDGKHCAFAYMCINPFVELETYENVLAREVLKNHPNRENLLKEEFRGHPNSFYECIQALHDTERFWTKDGLSETGEVHIKHLKGKWPVTQPS